MTNRYIYYLAGLTVLNVFLYATGWELLFRDLVEPYFGFKSDASATSTTGPWGYIITATIFTGLAIIGPFLLLAKTNRARNQAEAAQLEIDRALKERVTELEETKATLEKQSSELAKLADDLQIARHEAENANRAKSSFLASMSHELRTPLNAVIGFSEIMKNESLGPMGTEEYLGYSEDIHASGQHLLGLINNVLDLSKVDAGKVELVEEPFNPTGVVKSVLSMLRIQAEKQGVELTTDVSKELMSMRADRQMLKQIHINMLSNAIKFTPEGGTITVKAWSGLDSGHVFQVIDTGIGITLEDIPKILQPFTQAENTLSRHHEGTGLGLPLAKNLVELHGGYLDFQSKVGAGSTVTVRFPKERILQKEAKEEAASPAA
jgi:two-component system cell cycle sensor histidine kinase PleC